MIGEVALGVLRVTEVCTVDVGILTMIGGLESKVKGGKPVTIQPLEVVREERTLRIAYEVAPTTSSDHV